MEQLDRFIILHNLDHIPLPFAVFEHQEVTLRQRIMPHSPQGIQHIAQRLTTEVFPQLHQAANFLDIFRRKEHWRATTS
jgi:hypothetical protein